MPTAAEIKELESLEWNYEENYGGSGIPGWKITAKNGKSIFLTDSGNAAHKKPFSLAVPAKAEITSALLCFVG